MQHRLRQQEEEMRRRQQENTMFLQEQNNDNNPEFRRPHQPPPIFDRPMMGNNGPHNLMDLQMVCQTYLISFLKYWSFKLGLNNGLSDGPQRTILEPSIYISLPNVFPKRIVFIDHLAKKGNDDFMLIYRVT